MEKITIENINFLEAPTSPVEIIVRDGRAADPINTVQPQRVKITGDLNTPSSYAEERFAEDEIHEDTIVEYSDNPEDAWIILEEDFRDPMGSVVKGELLKNNDLKAFEFNNAGVFTNKTFIEVIRKNAHCFASIQEAKALIKQLQSFVAKFTTSIEDLDDRKGETKNLIETKLQASKTGIPESVNFKMPLFSGGPMVDFTVEVEIDVVMTSNKPEAKFGFFSLELPMLMRTHAELTIQKHIAHLRKKFTCIRKN